MDLNTTPLSQIDREVFPLLAEGVYFVECTEAEVKPKKTGDGNNLLLVFKVLDEYVTTAKNVEQKNNGYTLRQYVSLTAKQGSSYNPDQQLALLADAISGFGQPGLADPDRLQLEDLKGACLKLKVGIQQATDKFDAQNTIKGWLPITENDNFVKPQTSN